jgi:hypothetical protein
MTPLVYTLVVLMWNGCQWSPTDAMTPSRMLLRVTRSIERFIVRFEADMDKEATKEFDVDQTSNIFTEFGEEGRVDLGLDYVEANSHLDEA